MSLKVRNYQVVVGQPPTMPIQQSTNEDVQHVFAFVDAPAPLGTGNPIDLTDMATATMTIKDGNGTQLAQVSGGVVGQPTAGALGFTVLHGAVAGGLPQAYDVDVLIIDNAGKQNQLLVATPFLLDEGVT